MIKQTAKTLSIALVLCLAFSQPAGAQRVKDPDQYYKSPSSIHGKTVLIPAGSHIEGRINNTISSKSKAGQKFSIEITSPVLANGTDVVIPSGSRIIGEIVEAIPSRHQKKIPGMRKRPLGKLRTQLNVLKTPDGVAHPIIAKIAGEYTSQHGRIRENRDIANPNMGYVGSQASFNAVHPGLDKRKSWNRGPKVVGRREFFRDPILGTDAMRRRGMSGTPVVRAMTRRGRDVYIYEGSPLTVKLTAPLKLGIAPSKGRLSIDLGPVTPKFTETSSGFRRFAPVGSPQERSINKMQQQAAEEPGIDPRLRRSQLKEPPPPDPEAHLPVFLRKSKSEKFRESFNVDRERRQASPQQAPPQQAQQRRFTPQNSSSPQQGKGNNDF